MKPFRASEEDWQTVENGSQQEGAYIIVPVWRTIRELRDRVAALEASAAAAIEPPAEPPDAPQTLHTVALAMVDILERLFPAVLPEILDTIRRAIREPMVATGEGPVPTDEKLLDEHWDPSDSVAGALRSAYNLGRQHASTTCPDIRQGDGDLAQQAAPPAPLPALEVGQKWRRRDGVVVEVTRFDVGWEVGDWLYDSDHKYGRNDKSEPHQYDLIELVSAAPAPVESLQVEDESLKPLWQIMCEAQELELKDNPMAEIAEVYKSMIFAVADWCQKRGNMIASGSQWAELLRQEAGK
jgi:hypothetical protein